MPTSYTNTGPKATTLSIVTTSSRSGGFPTQGSGTYTTPTNPSPVYLRIRMCGGGAGGGGSGTVGTGVSIGSNGSATTFGSSLLTANGGLANTVLGANASALGGSCTINSPAIAVMNYQGGAGGGGPATNASFILGSPGGVNFLGGAGPAGGIGAENTIPAPSAIANTGGGGGGAGSYNTGSAGSGGGAGGYLEAIIMNPAATYSYSVGAGGNGGSRGTGGNPGGAGGSGIIIVEEHY